MYFKSLGEKLIIGGIYFIFGENREIKNIRNESEKRKPTPRGRLHTNIHKNNQCSYLI